MGTQPIKWDNVITALPEYVSLALAEMVRRSEVVPFATAPAVKLNYTCGLNEHKLKMRRHRSRQQWHILIS